ncbi:SPOR domain-containing protein [Halomonas sp. 328]|uniref:SPOR domain-containing protein n=1 Tax=Halomonas sp. 328 TaxID=2776704 RepID=UPI0018A72C99|nr:SPOR domain-containing protein [Halomonas sp. 328]MBF8222360.1 SPOR domain-containing protein [Halomonas sp. 328]
MASRRQSSPPKRRGASSRKRASAQRRGLPGWLWGVGGLLAGYFLAQHFQASAPSPTATVLPRPASEAPAERAEEPRTPTFEFYTLLPESEVIAPRSETQESASRPTPPPRPERQETTPPASEPAAVDEDPIARVIAANLAEDEARSSPPAASTPASPPTSAAGHRYMLQAASFREVGDAQRLAGRLRDFGLVARISEVSGSDGNAWHRVQVGPYEDTRELNRAQDLMVTQGIEPLLIRLQN